LRDQLGIIRDSSEIEALARSVDDNGGVHVVPAFSGLFAPHWRPDARGVITGLTQFANRAHLARAALEAAAFQTRELLEAMQQDTGIVIGQLRVDGGMTANALLMQFQADLLGIPVLRPRVLETTALGAAYAAGLATGFWNNIDELRDNWQIESSWQPQMPLEQREARMRTWRKAVARSLDWVD
jgi:glycerol kinase